MDKVPFYSKDTDFETFGHNYHPEMFDLLNYYQSFEDNNNKSYQDENKSNDINGTNDVKVENKNTNKSDFDYIFNYPEF